MKKKKYNFKDIQKIGDNRQNLSKEEILPSKRESRKGTGRQWKDTKGFLMNRFQLPIRSILLNI
ncbi:MAG: hypothetical protein ACLUIS_03145 [Longibaculum sp.]